MTDRLAPVLSKWPFLIGDGLLVGMAGMIVFRSAAPLSLGQAILCLVAVALGAWMCALPFLREYHAKVRLTETETLASTVGQMENLELIRNQITQATAQWQLVQEQSGQTVGAAKELSDRMKAEMSEFCAFLQKTQDAEKQHLRLEVEKLRRSERDWLQATVVILDHVHALHAAAARSGQPGVMGQLNQFQFACRDAVRRVGLGAFAPAAGDSFNAQAHQLENGAEIGDATALVTEVLAAGYTYQGELVRRALVRVGAAQVPGS